ncbi:MAG: FtsX-like permease family protein [Intestinibacter sp.]|uniref:ABC transporter permease n=1 Tax=Intestinibacter sp. TaxID=1965304 RepID=UPI0025C5A419|nr:FtsX-like permease family protein [Intestinibacter sp.]MCI6737084.1 FtsX-like permease family protein [Intestinibacter sp.]
MNLYTSLTIRYLKENKRRTLVTIIGIILSTALICGIGNICMSLLDYEMRSAISSNSDFYASFYDLNKKDALIVSKSAEVSKYGYKQEVGSALIDKEKASLLEVNSFDKNAFDSYMLIVEQGEFPKNENEIILSQKAIKNLNKKIGDTIELEVGDTEYDETNTFSKVTNSNKKSYKIVGIMSKPDFEVYNSLAICGFDINSKSNKDKFTVFIATKNPKGIYDTTMNIAKQINLAQSENPNDDRYSYNQKTNTYYKNIDFNEHLLRLLGASVNETTNTTIISIVVLVASLVIICTIATIYNSFSISISERKKQFGILNSIGATKSQIMKLVFLEALLISIIGIPIGLLSGTVAIDIVFKIIESFFKTSLFGELGLKIVFSLKMLIVSTLIILITIAISTILPAINAAKTSPLEAIKNSANLKVGKVKKSRLVKLIFKTEGELAYKNLRRNKGKFRITLFSLVISIVIFISFNGFMDMFLKANNVYYGQITSDLTLYANKPASEEKTKKLVDEIRKTKGVNDVAYDFSYNVVLSVDQDDINQKNKELIDKSFEKKGNSYEFTFNSLRFPGEISIKKINLVDGSFDKDKAVKENGVILVKNSYAESTGKKSHLTLTNYKVGDTLKATVEAYDNKTGDSIQKDVELKVMAITEDIITGNNQYKDMGYDIVAYDELIEKLDLPKDKNLYSTLNISTDKSEQVRKEIKRLAEDSNFNVYDKVEGAKQNQQTMDVMKIFVYGFIVVISLVSVTNIVNTISTNINLRKREFAVIKSIGVTPGGFNKIIYLESFLYGILSLLYGVPIGVALNILMCRIVGNMISFDVMIPYKAILISVVGIFIITFIASYIPMKKISKENIMDNIRQESI